MGQLIRVLLTVIIGTLVGCSSSPSTSDIKALSAQEQQRQQLNRHFEEGEALYKSGKFKEAEVVFLTIHELVPGEPNASYRLGTILFRVGDYDRSAGYFEEAIKGNPKNYKAHYNLASIRLMQAENHFKYFAALVDPDTDLQKVSQLMADIDKFTRKDVDQVGETSLDHLATTIKK